MQLTENIILTAYKLKLEVSMVRIQWQKKKNISAVLFILLKFCDTKVK